MLQLFELCPSKFLLTILYIIFLLQLKTEAQLSNEEEEDICLKYPVEMGYRHHCYQLKKWDKDARDLEDTQPGMAAIPSTIHECMDLDCACTFIEGSTTATDGSCVLKDGSKLQKALRREIRTISEDERQRLFKAMQAIKDSGEYDEFARMHKHGDMGFGAHSGPAFLGWHREFTKRFELSIRKIDPTLSLPYYDMTLDDVLPDGQANNSVIFSKYLLGETIETHSANYINDGPFSNWNSPEGNPKINRSVGTLPGSSRPMTQAQVDRIMSLTDIVDMLAYPFPKPDCPYKIETHYPEMAHGSGHNFVGGDMSELMTAAIDPIFFLFHSYIDKIWEDWRQLRQTRTERETQYPDDDSRCAAKQHFAKNGMYPFIPLINLDGLTNNYTDFLYSYAPKPTCSREEPDGCNSEFLFCDLRTSKGRCASKMKPGARCDYWMSGENPCYLGECRQGKCVETQTKSISQPTDRPEITHFVDSHSVKTQVEEQCYNEHKCCQSYQIIGYCNISNFNTDDGRANVLYTRKYCPASCDICKPTTYFLNDECYDRHPSCPKYARKNECITQKYWMEENCRKSCNKCLSTRFAECNKEWKELRSIDDLPINVPSRLLKGNENADDIPTQIPTGVPEYTTESPFENAPTLITTEETTMEPPIFASDIPTGAPTNTLLEFTSISNTYVSQRKGRYGITNYIIYSRNLSPNKKSSIEKPLINRQKLIEDYADNNLYYKLRNTNLSNQDHFLIEFFVMQAYPIIPMDDKSVEDRLSLIREHFMLFLQNVAPGFVYNDKLELWNIMRILYHKMITSFDEVTTRFAQGNVTDKVRVLRREIVNTRYSPIIRNGSHDDLIHLFEEIFNRYTDEEIIKWNTLNENSEYSKYETPYGKRMRAIDKYVKFYHNLLSDKSEKFMEVSREGYRLECDQSKSIEQRLSEIKPINIASHEAYWNFKMTWQQAQDYWAAEESNQRAAIERCNADVQMFLSISARIYEMFFDIQELWLSEEFYHAYYERKRQMFVEKLNKYTDDEIAQFASLRGNL